MKNDREPYEKTKQLIQDIGPGFCAAKWYAATIWLANGRTASCHHPIAHTVPKEEVISDSSALHNSLFKKEQRKTMLEGGRPDECGYCWRVEDADPTQFSDRVYKSEIYSHDEIKKLPVMPWNKNVNPKRLEISFDNLCNLSCTYCNSEFSSTWANDIKTNGSYENMKTNGGLTYRTPYEFEFDPKSEENIYIQKFFEWFEHGLREDLDELRVTGGEPSRSPHFWKLVDLCENEDFKFSVNSNLQMNKTFMDKLIDCSARFKDFELFTSGEAFGAQAEFIRHGLEYDTWKNNLVRFVEEGSYTNVNVMMTINALCLFSITDFLDEMIKLKNKYDSQVLFHLSVNILRFPSFQSVNILPSKIKNERADAIEQWLAINNTSIRAGEEASLQRLVSYLRNVDKSYEDADSMDDKENDFYHFYKQYADRRNLVFLDIFNNHELLSEWWNRLEKEYEQR